MTRYGQQYGPDFTFLGVPACDLDDPSSYAGADVVIVGAPFDGGTSHRPGPGSAPWRSAAPTTCPTTGPGPAWPCAPTGWPTCAWSTPETSRCTPVTSRWRF